MIFFLHIGVANKLMQKNYGVVLNTYARHSYHAKMSVLNVVVFFLLKIFIIEESSIFLKGKGFFLKFSLRQIWAMDRVTSVLLFGGYYLDSGSIDLLQNIESVELYSSRLFCGCDFRFFFREIVCVVNGRSQIYC